MERIGVGEGELFGCGDVGNPLLELGVVLPSEESARFNPQYPAENGKELDRKSRVGCGYIET